MFTGIIEEQGKVISLRRKTNLTVLELQAGTITRGLKLGESVAVNGVCLTVTKLKNKIISFDIMKETIERTTLKTLRPLSVVNLERALLPTARFSGHFVTGHVDGTGTIRQIIQLKHYVALQITIAPRLKKFLVPQGSVCIDGVSLTVGKVGKKDFTVHLIPFTLKVTNLGLKKTGDKVNIETDILAKYILLKK